MLFSSYFIFPESASLFNFSHKMWRDLRAVCAPEFFLYKKMTTIDTGQLLFVGQQFSTSLTAFAVWDPSHTASTEHE